MPSLARGRHAPQIDGNRGATFAPPPPSSAEVGSVSGLLLAELGATHLTSPSARPLLALDASVGAALWELSEGRRGGRTHGPQFQGGAPRDWPESAPRSSNVDDHRCNRWRSRILSSPAGRADPGPASLGPQKTAPPAQRCRRQASSAIEVCGASSGQFVCASEFEPLSPIPC